ncbi:MAG: hypothetical protein M3033_04490 [Acidobacteriota bacterium]|nr:hypothetical protein [Acidobacteriota bacterium]
MKQETGFQSLQSKPAATNKLLIEIIARQKISCLKNREGCTAAAAIYFNKESK